VTDLTTTLPSIQTFATNLLADTILLRLFTAHTLPYINSVMEPEAFFWVLAPWRLARQIFPKRR